MSEQFQVAEQISDTKLKYMEYRENTRPLRGKYL